MISNDRTRAAAAATLRRSPPGIKSRMERARGWVYWIWRSLALTLAPDDIRVEGLKDLLKVGGDLLKVGIDPPKVGVKGSMIDPPNLVKGWLDWAS